MRDVAAAVGLAEGEPGVRAVLGTLARLEPVSIRRVSREVELPVPIVAAVCGELRKRRVVAEQRPAQLTSLGRRLFATGVLDLERGLGPVGRELAAVAAAAPRARLELDQCHCTVETKLKRVLALHDAGALVARRVLLLGDDDLVSVALRLVVERLGSTSTLAGLAVVDVDPDVIAFLRDRLAGAPFTVDCVEHDLRRPLPRRFARAFGTVVTDPPYTIAGARLFLSRAAEALAGPGGDVFLSFGSKRPEASLLLQREIWESGFSIRSLHRDFNEYVGAGVLGGSSHLYHLAATAALDPPVAGAFAGPLYTADG